MSYDFELKYNLIAQSPQIHFQARNSGSTLRATEVKPKLDRYLIRLAKIAGVDYKNWMLSDNSKALDYKMRITAGQNRIGDMRIEDFRIYYGNMGAEERKELVFRDCKLSIVCFNKELRKFIDKYIKDFFIVTNFGTMQGKGFGSYVVENWDAGMSVEAKEQYVVDRLCKDSGAQYCYVFDAATTLPKTFARIKTVYALMKSGINFHSYSRSLLIKYMHEKKRIGNEKAWLKQKRIAPAIGRQSYQHDDKNYYVRALLGVADRNEYIKDLHNRGDKATVFIKNVPEDGCEDVIERFPSPIFFKIVGNTVYYIARSIHPSIYGKKFCFESSNYHTACNIGYLTVPTIEKLGNDFIDDFMFYCYKQFEEYDYLDRYHETRGLIIEEVKCSCQNT